MFAGTCALVLYWLPVAIFSTGRRTLYRAARVLSRDDTCNFLYSIFIPVILNYSWTVEVTEKSQEVYSYVYYISRGIIHTTLRKYKVNDCRKIGHKFASPN